MKRILILILSLLVSCSSSLVWADAAPAAGQASSQADQMANVQAIMARSQQYQAQQAALAAQQQAQQQASQQVVVQPASNGELKTNPGFFQSLFNDMSSSPKQQMSTQNQQPAGQTYYSSAANASTPAPQPAPIAAVDADSIFQNATNQRLDALEQSEAATQAKLAQFAQAISMINEEVVQLTQQTQTAGAQPALATNSVNSKTALDNSSVLNTVEGDGHNRTMQYVLYVILLLLVIIILLMLMPRRSAFRLETVESNSETVVGDYDVMASEEGVATKLDLARAYIAMEDYHAAARILAEVKKAGNKQQREDADKMSSSIPGNA